MPSQPQFDLNRHELCPLKNVCRAYQAVTSPDSAMEHVDPEEFKPAIEDLTPEDYEKFKIWAQGEDNEFYTVDDSNCEDPEIVKTPWGRIQVACGAVIAAKPTGKQGN